jgi:glycosyltransferase involved in cell wall biosynthesis
MTPLLCICVPTYGRAGHVADLLALLTREIGDRDDVVVLVSDNASPDGTAEVLAAHAARSPWLRVHRQDENVGPFRNLQWLIEHAPASEYLWCFGDDDRVLPGALAHTVELLREHHPTWLFNPYDSIDRDGVVGGGSPVPGVVQHYADAPAMYREWHHWLTFLSSSVVRTEAMQRAVRDTTAENAYLPLLWAFRAALHGPCMVAAEPAIRASQDISWADVAHLYQTLHFTSLFDDGLCLGLTEEEFGTTLDGLYVNGFGDWQWRKVPLERLVEAVRRFPQSQGLRRLLWEIAGEQERPDVLSDLDAACRAMGLHRPVAELVAAGERAFAAGELPQAARLFAEATELMPTSAPAWNGLAVAGFYTGDPEAVAAAQAALFVAPDDADALANHAAISAAQIAA